MNFALAYKLKHILIENSSTILTGAGVVGTVSTAFLTGRASFRSAEILRFAKMEITKDRVREIVENDAEANIEEIYNQVKNEKLPRMDTVKLVWKEYLPPVGVGVLTVSSIIVAHRIDAKRIVALTLASGVSERAYKEYKEKVLEKLGKKEEGKIRDEIAQDRVNNTPGGELVIVDEGKVLCMEALTGRYFQSSRQEIDTAFNNVNHDLNNNPTLGISLAELFDEFGLRATPYSQEVGWNSDKMIKPVFSSTIAENGRPCLVVDYDPRPFSQYEDSYH